ncbi:lyase family protein, partial [Mycobacterium kansasii]
TQLREQISALSELVTRHRATPMVARTLTQHAAPTTFGAKAAAWLNGVVDAFDRMAALTTPVQIGGAAGTLAATTELA